MKKIFSDELLTKFDNFMGLFSAGKSNVNVEGARLPSINQTSEDKSDVSRNLVYQCKLLTHFPHELSSSDAG